MSIFGPPDARIEKMKAKKNVKGLIRVLARGRDLKLRIDAADALGVIGDPRAVPPLIKVLCHKVLPFGLEPSEFVAKTSDNNSLRSAAARALGAIGDERAVEPLTAIQHEGTGLGLALDGSNWLREAAAEALDEIAALKSREANGAHGYGLQSRSGKPRSQSAPKLPASLPGPMPKHEFVTSSKLKEGPGPGESDFQTALGHWNANRYDQAAEHYIKAIELGLTSVYEAASRSNLGKIFLMQDDVEAAVDQFLKGLYLSPLTASTAYSCSSHLALIYEELGMTDDMLAVVEVAEVALKRIDSIMSAEAASKVRATVRRVYG